MSCGESSGPHGIGSAARMMAGAPLRGEYVRQQPRGRLRAPPRDIIISTPPKCGTTWTQMICALLILQEPELPLPLDTLPPWIDMVTRARTACSRTWKPRRTAGSSRPRTPLDGIPELIRRSRTSASGGTRAMWGCRWTTISTTPTSARSSANANGRPRSTVPSPDHCGHRGRAPGGERDRFWQWVCYETPSTQVGLSLRRTWSTWKMFVRRRRSRRRVFALRRPQGRPGGADAADGRAPRHRRRRAPMAPPGPGGDVRVDAQQGLDYRPRRRSGALDRSRRVLQPRTPSGATSSTTPASPRTPRVRALASGNLVEWVHREPID